MKTLSLDVPDLEVSASEKGFACRTKTATCPFLLTEGFSDFCFLSQHQPIYRDNGGTGYLVPIDTCVMSKLY